VTALYLYDDARARTFEPFASTRPISEMVAGAVVIRERWRTALQTDHPFFLAGPRHRDFDEGDASAAASGVIPAGSIIANARCVPALPEDIANVARRAASCSMWRVGNQLAAVRIKEPIDAARFEDGSFELDTLAVGTGSIGKLGGWWHEEVWDFIGNLQEQLAHDIRAFSGQSYAQSGEIPAHVTVLGKEKVILLGDATIEPHVVLDASAGPILINAGTHVRAFTRVTGPCYIGRDVQVMGGDITGCSIGDVCKVRGEVSSTIFAGYANKGHDGFVGHSYLGRWVNLGAGTITSNLKNTYGTVALWTPSGVRDSGLQFLGTLFGDHVKTGIGLRLTTGCVLGAGANVYDRMPPKVVPPFAWGGEPPYSVYRADKFVETAARMMSRRHVELSERARRHLMTVHEGRWTVETEMDEA
jgi:UDP-N-acetylglucosamine diphosphorylase / glucose-1-phosphate thymidylyltransferase / UDP-N-acetylgalactosamine diphosphorylase / glucosamine-1-phosphate N-acetyltransferase / galactosamine-1-phosphate N-acetyltransferase